MINLRSQRPHNEIRTCTYADCYLCCTPGEPLYEGLKDHLFGSPGTWMLVQCPKCGLVWLNPRPVPEEIGKLYTEYLTHTVPRRAPSRLSPLVRAIKQGILASAFGYPNTGVGRAGKFVGQALSWIGPLRDMAGRTVMWLPASWRGRLLDVGCGNGQFLNYMRSMGWEVMGVEPDPKAIRVARDQFSIEIAQGTLEEAALPAESFDAITMFHVIEHLSDPIRCIRECQRVLKQGGRIVVVTPNIQSVGSRWFGNTWRGLEPPRHLFLFSPRTLRVCAERAGLQVQILRTVAPMTRWLWYASSLYGGNGDRQGPSYPKAGWGLRLSGLGFLVLDHLLATILPVGEYVLMVARKGTR